MLSDHQKEKLKSNWGDKADSMACMAEVRVYDPLSSWECYIYALNPEDEDEVDCIIKVSTHQEATVERWFMKNISGLFNSDGEHPIIDIEYRPRRAAELFKTLNKGLT